MPAAIDGGKLIGLIRPRSVAIFGGHWAAEVIRQCQKIGFTGDIWPVHPKHETIEGLKVYKSVKDLPAAPDASFIGVNREITVPIVKQLSELGAGGAVCFSSGYTETLDGKGDSNRGQELQDALIEAASDMPVLGPNCYGFINYFDGALLWPDQHGGHVLGNEEKGVAIIAQSSNMAINMTMQQRDLPIGYMMTVGNQAKVGLSQLGLALLEDPRVSCLGLHVEGFDSISGMEALAQRAYELRKPIVVLKVGKSEQAQVGTFSHTASLAGAHAASQAFIARLGMAEVSSVPSFLDTLKFINWFGVLPGNKLSAMVCSGGEASLIADMAVGKNIEFTALSQAARTETETALGPMVTVANPLDFHTYIWENAEQTTAAFSGMLSGGFDLSILIQDFPQAPLSDRGWQTTTESLIAAKQHIETRQNKKLNVVMVSSLIESMPNPALREQYAKQGLLCFGGFDEILIAAEAAAKVGSYWQNWQQHGCPAALVAPAASSDRPWTMDEHQAKQQLQLAGLNTPKTVTVTSVQDSLIKQQDIGFPLVAKALGIAHKTEQNAVRLNIQSNDELEQVATELFELTDTILLESMVSDTLGELIIGVTNDPQYGLFLTIGLGGTLVELLKDSTSLLLPATPNEIETAIDTLKIAPLFDSYRGQKAWSKSAVLKAVLAVQSFALKYQHTLLELDINPLLVSDTSAVAVDALALFNQNLQNNLETI
jgi:acyl-CoA synthetase (NDP forming)